MRHGLAWLLFAWSAAGLARDAGAQAGPAPTPPPAAMTAGSAGPAPQTPGLPVAGSAAQPRVAESGVPLSLLHAVTTALQRHPVLITARSSLDLARADHVSAAAPFDSTLTAAAAHNHTVAPQFATGELFVARNDVTSLSLGGSKALLWGTNIAADVELARNHARPALGPVAQTASVNLQVTQPLLRGAGTVGAASALRAGAFNAQAAEDTLKHVAQQQAFSVIIAYWDLVSAEQQLALFEASLARAQRLLDETKVLVDKDQRPRGDLRPLEAGLATRKRDVLSFQSARLRAVHALHLAMGLDRKDSAEWHPTDGFPEPGMPAASVDSLMQRALQGRFDVQAARKSALAAAALQRGAEHNTLPRLDLTLSVGYTGGQARDGVGPFVGALGRNVQGPNAGAALRLELPVENSAQLGERMRAAAQRTAAETVLFDLARTMRSNVAAAHDELRFAVASLREAVQAEQLYDMALNDERYKLRAGLSTVIDVVLTEDLLTQATRARIATQLDVGVALARLRLELGLLPSQPQGAAQALAGVMNAGMLDGS